MRLFLSYINILKIKTSYFIPIPIIMLFFFLYLTAFCIYFLNYSRYCWNILFFLDQKEKDWSAIFFKPWKTNIKKIFRITSSDVHETLLFTFSNFVLHICIWISNFLQKLYLKEWFAARCMLHIYIYTNFSIGFDWYLIYSLNYV